MEIVLIVVVAVILGAAIYVYNKNKTFDINKDGKVDLTDAESAIKLIKEDVKSKADVNKDGKIDAADAKAVKEKAKAGAKKAAAKAKDTVEKTVKSTSKKRQFKPKAK